jgi:hypothetical protein
MVKHASVRDLGTLIFGFELFARVPGFRWGI